MSISDWLDFMPSEVTIYPWTSQSVSGVPSYSSVGNVYPCRIEMKNHRIIDANSREVTARGRIFLGSTTVPDTRSKIVLPSGFVPVSPPILAANLVDDEDGPHHVVLELG